MAGLQVGNRYCVICGARTYDTRGMLPRPAERGEGWGEGPLVVPLIRTRLLIESCALSPLRGARALPPVHARSATRSVCFALRKRGERHLSAARSCFDRLRPRDSAHARCAIAHHAPSADVAACCDIRLGMACVARFVP